MKSQLFLGKVVVKKSPTHGFGVFATKTFKKGEKIEECYMLLSKSKDEDKGLEDYYFDAGNRKNAIFLGFGCIYNHSEEPNADYSLNIKKKVATFKANQTIPKGSEIFVSYGDDWFSDRGWEPKETMPAKVKKKKRK